MKRNALLSLLLFILSSASLVFAEETTTQLNPVVVTATKTEKNPEDVTQPITVITGEQIKKTGAVDVATAVENATGVHIGNYGTPGSVQSLILRGAPSAQVLVLLDGIRMNSARDGGFDLSFIPVSVEDLERIEIVRGPASALYGSDAVGGVINIITKKPSENKSTLKGVIGSHDYDDLYASNAGRRDAWYYSLSGERETSDGYRINSDLYQWILGGKAGYDLSKTSSVELAANYLQKDYGSPGSTIWGITPHARLMERNRVFSGTYRGNAGSDLNLKLTGYRKLDDLSYNDPDFIDFMTGLPAPINNRFETRSDGGEAQFSWLVASWNQLTGGYELRRDHLESTFSGTPSTHAASLNAYYLQDEINIGEPLIVVAGGRVDDHSVYGDKFSPKASARYFITNTATIIRASYGRSFRAPTFNDLYFQSSDAVGNPNLRPETAREYEGGIEQRIGEKAVLTVTGFDRKVKDLIQWDWSVFPMTVVNIGRAHIRGWEAEASYGVAGVATISLNYTYTNPIDETTGEKIYDRTPKTQTKAVLTVVPIKNLYLTIEGRAVENYTRPGEPSWKYSVMDAKIAEKIGNGGEIFFAMNNVFDRKYEVVKGYPMPPREIRGGVSFSF